jgi:hypothetical protein
VRSIDVQTCSSAFPFAVAGVLNMLVIMPHPPFNWRAERIAGYGFAFGAPWAWLLDHVWLWGWLDAYRPVDTVVTYMTVLWIPAMLYALCIWLAVRSFKFVLGHMSRDYFGRPFSS